MLKNVKLKRFLKSSIFPVLTLVNKCIPKKDNFILLYSANSGINHNLRPLKEYLLENNYNEKYRIICGIEKMKYAEDDSGVIYVPQLAAMLYFFVSKHVYYTTGQIPVKPSKRQIVIHLDHGTTAIKTGNLLSNINNGDDFFFTYYTAPSSIYVPIVQREFLCTENNIVINGEPVNDIFFKPYEKYDLGDYKAVGLWAPTFKQSNTLGYDDSSEGLLPMFDQDDYTELNEVLKQHNIRLIVKLHDMQDLGEYENLNFSHLDILSDTDFKKRGYELYPLLLQTDFLIADYSSVFLQYLLLDKPIAFAIPDIEEYQTRRGFIFDNVLDYMPGHKAKTKTELYAFFENLANGKDDYKADRERVRNAVHYYQDGNNCARALEIGQIFK